MEDYQKQFVQFLLDEKVLTFGDFVTKSGRKTPYFVNTGKFNSGSSLSKLGKFYAEHIVKSDLQSIDIVFGPAYKGIPLAVTTGIALSHSFNINVGVSFDRKEEKGHGDKGKIVGRALEAGNKLIIVEDVVTAGTTIRSTVPALRKDYGVIIDGIVIAVDRCEKGQGDLSALSELQNSLDVKINPIINIHQIVNFLESTAANLLGLPADLPEQIRAYLEQYGA